MREGGAFVRTASVDLANEVALSALIDDIANTMPPVRGIIHAAGILDDATIERLDADRFDDVLRPKLLGALHLDLLTAHLQLDFFVVYSAGAAWLGSTGQANYAAANAALDGFAQARHALGKPTLSIAWGRWAGGMAARQSDANWEKRGIAAIVPSLGFAALFDLLDFDIPNAALMPLDWSRYAASSSFGRNGTSEFLAAVRSTVRVPETHTSMSSTANRSKLAELKEVPADQRPGALRTILESMLRHIVGLPESQPVDPRAPLRDLGMDSLMTVELRNAIGRAFECALPATLVFDHPTLDALTNHLMGTLPGLRAEQFMPLVAITAKSADGSPSFDDLKQLDALSEEEAEELLLREISGRGAA
jgi:NAD(P)-dependent dehydrogenase (short-subunit alcohol dehydrogenase family)/acyl carrier protein